MTQALRYQFELFGPLKGKTKSINGHRFVDGKCDIICDSGSAGHLLRYMSFYNAFARGTPEYNNAVDEENGTDSVSKSGQRDSAAQVQSEFPEVEQQVGETHADSSEGTIEAESGQAGERPGGNGHTDSGVPTFEEFTNRTEPAEPTSVANDSIRSAVLKLDPENDEHWTTMGLPRVDAVEEAYGKAGVTRGDIKAAFPQGWDRDAAIKRLTGANV